MFAGYEQNDVLRVGRMDIQRRKSKECLISTKNGSSLGMPLHLLTLLAFLSLQESNLVDPTNL